MPARSHLTPSDFFDAAHIAYLRAERSAGLVKRSFRIGRQDVRLHFAGHALQPVLTPALEHLATESSAPAALTVCLFDTVTTGAEPPPPQWSSDDYIARGEVRGYSDSDIQIGYNVGTGVLSMLHTECNLALYWVRDARRLPYYESGAPLRTLLHWWLRGRGVQLCHAAAVGTATGAVLLAGRGGSGKSTTALVCLAAGMRYLGDDYVLLSASREPTVHSLYCSAKLDAEQMRCFPALSRAVANSERLETEKALAFLWGQFSDRVATSLPLRAVLTPHITGRRDTRVIQSSHAAALRALAPSTIFQLPDAGQDDFRFLSDVVRRVPCFALELGTDLTGVAEAVRAFLEEMP